MPQRSRTLNVNINGNNNGLVRSFRGAGDAAQGFGRHVRLTASITSKGFAVMRVGAAGVGAAVAGAVLASKGLVTVASDVAESTTKNDVLFGRYAKTIDAYSRTTAASLGVSRREALAAAGEFGGLFSALDIGQKSSAQMSQQLVTLAADLASFNNATPEEALTALRSGLAGESEPLRRFSAFLTEARVKAEAYRSGIANTGAELTEQQKVQARYNVILSDTAQAQGDAERTGNGYANQIRRFRAQFDDLKAGLGERLLPLVLKGTQSLNKFVGQIQSGEGAGGDFRRVVEDIAGAVGDAAHWLHEAGKDVKNFFDEFDRGEGTGGDVRKIVDDIVGAIGDATFEIDKFLHENKDEIDDWRETFLALGEGAENVFKYIVVPAVEFAYRVAKRVFPGMKQVVSGLIETIHGFYDIFAAILTLDPKRFLKGFEEQASGAVKAFGGILRAGTAQFREIAAGWAEDIVGGTVSKLGEVGTNIGKKVNGILRGISGFVGRGADWGSKLVTGIIRGIAGAPGKLADAIKSKLGDVGGFLTGQGDGIGRSIVKSGSIGAAGAFGAGLMGASPRLGWVAAEGARDGLHVSSGLRPGAITSSGNPSFHGTGEALDVAGLPGKMLAFARRMKARFGTRLAELIYTPMGAGIKHGRPHTFTGRVAADHRDHVHVAVDLGRPGPGIGDGPGVAAAAARAAGFGGQELVNMVAIAGRESSWNPRAQNLTGPDHSIGLWQINQLAHKGRFGSDAQLMSPAANARAARALFLEAGYSPWNGPNGSWSWNIGADIFKRARAAVIGSRAGSGGGGSAGSRGGSSGALQLEPSMKSARALGVEIDDAATAYGQRERELGLSDEDLGTAGGRGQRLREIGELRRLQGIQLLRQRQRAAALRGAIGRLEARLKATRRRRDKARGKARVALNDVIRGIEQDLIDLRVDLKGLGVAIKDTELELGQLDKDAGEVAATPDTPTAAEPQTATDFLASRLDIIDAQERAGDYTAEQARAERQRHIERALSGAFGQISDLDRLRLRGDLRELTQQTAQAMSDLGAQLAELTAAVQQQTTFARQVVATENYQLARGLADILSGQIVGLGMAGRGLMPGAGQLSNLHAMG